MASGAGAPRRLRLLIDEMWSPAVARSLRERGCDAVSVAEEPGLRGRPDEVLFMTAVRDFRAIVTENVVDFRPLAHTALRAGRDAPTLIFTDDRRYPRADRRTIGRLVRRLEALIGEEDPPVGEVWLD